MALIGQLLANATEQLKSVSGEAAGREAILLLGYATGRQTTSLGLNLDDQVSSHEQQTFESAVKQRLEYKPVSQIIGKRDFWKHQFLITSDVLDPRPDTETLVEEALAGGVYSRVLDLGTGSGCILLSLLAERPNATGVGVDISSKALDVAKRNADALGLASRASLTVGDWCDGVIGEFDLVVSNPPYIAQAAMEDLSKEVLDWEPRIALTPEGDGLEAYRSIASGVGKLMTQGARLLLEIGFDQAESVSLVLENSGFDDINVIQDINRKDRVVTAIWNGGPL
jgi:release factor glutamine methyltransferase